MIVYLKILYLYITYWLLGLTEESFQYKKAWYLTELGRYHSAIYALKKAEKDLKTSYVYGLLGWCYIQIEAFDKALPYYRKAYEINESTELLLGLAVSECHAGSIEKSMEYYQQLIPLSNEPVMQQSLNKLAQEYERRKVS
jgi:tetratricopeptide (TPR) repeat protein